MRTNENDPYRLPQGLRYYEIRLTCGHVIKCRARPFSGRVKFGCDMGTGCGYNLHWTEYKNGAGEWVSNRLHPKE